MLHCRWLFLVWPTIVLNVLSPVFASACAAATGTLDVELCNVATPYGSTVQVTIDLQGDGSADGSVAHHNVAHCPYCPGFAVGLVLASLPALDVPPARFIYRMRQPATPAPVYARSALRVAGSRAPPVSPLLSIRRACGRNVVAPSRSAPLGPTPS